jgi:hypothetical protein
MIEYWNPEDPSELPTTLDFQYKSETDLYEFKKVRCNMSGCRCMLTKGYSVNPILPLLHSLQTISTLLPWDSVIVTYAYFVSLLVK